MSPRDAKHPRRAGVLLPLASLPSRYGVGDLGPHAHEFLELLKGCGASCWQFLPINPLGFGNSPYQPFSSYAGDPLYISLEILQEQGLLKELPPPFHGNSQQVAYDEVRVFKDKLLREAYARFQPSDAYEAFIAQPWVRPYGVYMTFKGLNHMRPWNEWPKAQRDWPYHPEAVDLAPYEDSIRYEGFLQFLFYSQWMDMRQHAARLGIEIVGDMPIYVGHDSQDVWMSRENFKLDAEGNPIFVAGAPPDPFCLEGQRWGNPVYDWEYHKKTGFAFWLERLRYSGELFDVVRIDHFLGFDRYWEIPVSCPTAVDGVWKEAPGAEVFEAVTKNLPHLKIIVEDLGALRKETYQLRDRFGFPGMKILQFAMSPGKKLHPGKGSTHMVVYTGTHDNPTILGWHRSQPFFQRLRLWLSFVISGYWQHPISRRYVRLALDDAADLTVIPAADILGLESWARINSPGTIGSPNWEWKLPDFQGLEKCLPAFAKDVRESGRGITPASNGRK